MLRKEINKGLKILLFAQSTFLNKGCEAIVLTTAKNIKEQNSERGITVATYDSHYDENYHNDVVNKYIPHLRECDLTVDEKREILIDGGKANVFLQKHVVDEIDNNDICMSIGGDNYCYGSPEWLYYIDNAVKRKNKKLILWGASINEDVVDEKFINDIRKFDILLIRESLTFNMLAKYVDSEKLILSPDTAFSLEAQAIKLPPEFNCGNEIIGLNMSPLILNYQSENVDILSSIKKLINHILTNSKYVIALIPHVYSEGGNDLDTLNEIKKLYPMNKRVFIVNDRIYNCSELKYIISKCKFLIAARTHASIAGYSMCVPTLVLGYSIKSKGIAKDIFGSYDNYVLSVQDLVDEKKIIEKFEFLLKNELDIRKILSQKMSVYFDKSKNLFEKVLSRIKEIDSKNITKKENCTGCTACKGSCPKSAINMAEDVEGFAYPVIDKKKCIDCGICREVCPNNKNYAYKFTDMQAFACKNTSIDERLASSSGGMFSLLAKNILRQGGCVFGAIYESYNVRHIKIDNEKELEKLKGSKYVESSMGQCYTEAKKELELGKKVLFSGVPCQIEGLKSFLGKEYLDLYCISVVCHGVPSKKVFSQHLIALEKKYNDELININFRNKSNGWKNYKIEYLFKNKIIVRDIQEDEYMVGFLKDYYLRQSCHVCDFRLLKKNTSDIILGDFWGIEVEDGSFDDDNGVSALIINSEKGVSMFNDIKDVIVSKKVNIEQIERHNPSLTKPMNIGMERFNFFDIFEKMGLSFAIDYFKKSNEVITLNGKLKQLHEDFDQYRESQKKLLIKPNERKIISCIITRFNVIFPHGSFRRKILRMGYKGVALVFNKIFNRK